MATNELEVERLHALYERAKQNGVPDIELVKGEEAINTGFVGNFAGFNVYWSDQIDEDVSSIFFFRTSGFLRLICFFVSIFY